MPVKLDAVIAKTEAALAAETDPRKLLTLQARLSSLLVAKAELDDDDSDDDDDDSDDDDDESKSKQAAKKADEAKRKAESAKHKARAAEFKKKAAEAEEEAKKAEESEEEEASAEADDEAKAALHLVQSLTGMTGAEALGAIRALAATAAKTAQDVAALKASNAATEKSNLIESIAKASTKQEREFLATQSIDTVRGFVKMRAKSGFVNTTDDQLIKPKHVTPGSEDSLPAETRQMIDQAVNVFPGDAKAKAEFRKTLVTNNINATLNGGRY